MQNGALFASAATQLWFTLINSADLPIKHKPRQPGAWPHRRFYGWLKLSATNRLKVLKNNEWIRSVVAAATVSGHLSQMY